MATDSSRINNHPDVGNPSHIDNTNIHVAQTTFFRSMIVESNRTHGTVHDIPAYHLLA